MPGESNVENEPVKNQLEYLREENRYLREAVARLEGSMELLELYLQIEKVTRTSNLVKYDKKTVYEKI